MVSGTVERKLFDFELYCFKNIMYYFNAYIIKCYTSKVDGYLYVFIVVNIVCFYKFIKHTETQTCKPL